MGSERSKAAGMLGIAAKAGRVRAGELACERSLTIGKASLCILAEDASANTKKKFTDLCLKKKIPVMEGIGTKDVLGHLTGKETRAVLTIEEPSLSQAIMKLVEKR